MEPKALNNFVFIIRDEPEESSSGLYIPEQGRVKPHYGMVTSVGDLVEDKNIQPNEKVMFHKGVGFTVEWEGIEYLVLEGEKVISIV